MNVDYIATYHMPIFSESGMMFETYVKYYAFVQRKPRNLIVHNIISKISFIFIEIKFMTKEEKKMQIKTL